MNERHAPNESTSTRTARVLPNGVAVWVNADELVDLGVDPDDTDAVEVRVEDGELRLLPVGGDGDT